MSVRIVTDSSCDLPDEIVTELGIIVVPLTIRFGEREYVDRFELGPTEFWAECDRHDELPATAAPPPGAFEQAYRALIAEGATGIVAVCLSGALSATVQSAEVAARQITGIEVRVVDSRTVSLGIGMIAIACARAGRDGASVDTVARLATDLARRTRVIGALDTLDNLKKGGRIGNARALVATALAIKPIIEVVDGVVEQAGKQRTRSKALAFLAERVRSMRGEIDDLAVLHADCDDLDAFVTMITDDVDGEIIIGRIGPVIGTHAGRGTIGVAFHERSPSTPPRD